MQRSRSRRGQSIHRLRDVQPGIQLFCLDIFVEVQPVLTGHRTQQGHRAVGHLHAAINTESNLRLSARLDAAGAVVPGCSRAELLRVVAPP